MWWKSTNGIKMDRTAPNRKLSVLYSTFVKPIMKQAYSVSNRSKPIKYIKRSKFKTQKITRYGTVNR